MSANRYLPALRFRALTRVYDPVVRLTTREGQFKRRLLEQAAIKAGDRVLDVGCGTGTLAVQAKRDQPEAVVTGVDGDPDVREHARGRAGRAELDVRFEHGFSIELPCGQFV